MGSKKNVLECNVTVAPETNLNALLTMKWKYDASSCYQFSFIRRLFRSITISANCAPCAAAANTIYFSNISTSPRLKTPFNSIQFWVVVFKLTSTCIRTQFENTSCQLAISYLWFITVKICCLVHRLANIAPV